MLLQQNIKFFIYIIFIVIIKSSGFVILSPKCRSIVFHIVWGSSPTSETTIGVVGCNLLWWNINVKPDVNVKVNVKASYGLNVIWKMVFVGQLNFLAIVQIKNHVQT